MRVYHLHMNKRQSKKLRTLYRRDYRHLVAERVVELPELLAQQIRPKPRWMPNMLYHWCMRVVLK